MDTTSRKSTERRPKSGSKIGREGKSLKDGLEVSGTIRGIHGELDNYPGLVGSQSEGEGTKGEIFDHMPIHQTPTDPLKILKVSKGFQVSMDDQHFVSLRIKITTQTHNSHN